MLVKDPSAVKDYGFDWSAWVSSGDSIQTSVFSAGTLAVTSQSISSHTTICFVSSGDAGSVHRLTNCISTTQGRIDERSVELQIINL